MFEHGDPIIKRHTERMQKLYEDNPHRDWKYNLSDEMIKELEKVMEIPNESDDDSCEKIIK